MKLEIYSPNEGDFIKEIKWNHEEIKKEVAEKVQYYKTLVYTDDQIQDAKKDRATLNKFVQALEDKRKEIKKQCLTPYEDFEAKMKEIISVVNEPIAIIDKQVKEYDKKKKDEKKNKIKEIFEGIGFQPFVKFESIFRSEWLNSAVSLKKIKEEMNASKNQIESDVAAVNALPEFSFEAMEVYQNTLDVSKAIQEGHRLADIQKRKAEYEAKRKAEYEAKKAAAEKAAALKAATKKPEEVATHITPPDPDDLPGQMNITDYPEASPEKKPEQAGRQWVGFKAFLTVDDAKALAEFFKARNIEFAPVKID